MPLIWMTIGTQKELGNSVCISVVKVVGVEFMIPIGKLERVLMMIGELMLFPICKTALLLLFFV